MTTLERIERVLKTKIGTQWEIDTEKTTITLTTFGKGIRINYKYTIDEITLTTVVCPHITFFHILFLNTDDENYEKRLKHSLKCIIDYMKDRIV